MEGTCNIVERKQRDETGFHHENRGENEAAKFCQLEGTGGYYTQLYLNGQEVWKSLKKLNNRRLLPGNTDSGLAIKFEGFRYHGRHLNC